MHVHIGVLGPLRVTTEGADVTIGSAKQRQLLAVLVAEAGNLVSTDRLIAELWGDDPPASALQSLRTYVYRLRETLSDDGSLLATRPPGYVLHAELAALDTHRFERLVTDAHEHRDPRSRLALLDEALALWRGGAFGEFADLDTVRPEAVRLEELGRVAAEERFHAKLALGEHADVVGELEAFVHRHPLREQARGQLMLALHRSGRSAEALATLREHRELLADELGLDVTGDLEALERDILQRSPAIDAPPLTATAPSSTTAPPSAAAADAAQGQPAGGSPAAAAASGTPPGSLPAEVASLVGREDELAELRATLERSRLVTITGTGGVGKTRVALRLARQLRGAHPDGSWWCDLAGVRDPARVADALATTLGLPPSEDRDPGAALTEYLRPRHASLVLDNAEHVADHLAPLVTTLITGCADLTVVVTSRAPLGVAGEQVHRLPPLSVDDHGEGPALELFLARSRAVRPDLEVDAAERARMAAICRRLDGLPLAIELAASRLRSLNPTDLADRLDDHLDLIVDPRQPTSRHRGLRAVLDWSFELLTPAERRLFCRLAVFAGPFTLEAAERVASGDGLAQGEIVDLLTRLVDHSLVSTLPTGGLTRYRLLETLRDYGLAQLPRIEGEGSGGGGPPVDGATATVRRRHAHYHLDFAEDADAQVRGRDEAIGVRRLDRTIDDLRAAHRWTLEQGEVDAALRLVAALFRYGLWRLQAEVLGWAEAVLALPGAATHRSFPVVAGMAGWAAGLRGNLDEATGWAQRGLQALSGADDPRAVPPLEVLMHTALWQGHLDDCLEHARRAAELTFDPYDLVPRYVPGLALTYAGRADEALAVIDEVQPAADRHGNPSMRSLVRYTRGEALLTLDPARALHPLEEAAELAAAVDNRIVLGVVDVSLVSVEARYGAPHAALDTYLAVIDRLHGAGDMTHLWTGLRGLVDVLAQLDRDVDAAVLLGAVRHASQAPPAYGEDADRLAAVGEVLRDRLGHDHLADAEARGEAMTDRDAIAFARQAIAQARPR